MSPPTGVQASPVATPGTLVRMATSLSNTGAPRMRGEIRTDDADRASLALGDAHGRVPKNLADLALQAAHAGLARVVADDLAQRVVVDGNLIGSQAVGLELAAQRDSGVRS